MHIRVPKFQTNRHVCVCLCHTYDHLCMYVYIYIYITLHYIILYYVTTSSCPLNCPDTVGPHVIFRLTSSDSLSYAPGNASG